LQKEIFMKLIHRKTLSDPKQAGMEMRYFASQAVAAATVGETVLNQVALVGILGNTKALSLDPAFPHIILGVGLYIRSFIAADIDLLVHGMTITISAAGKDIIKNILAALLPEDIAPQGSTAAAIAVGVRGPRFNFGDWLPLIGKSDEVQLKTNIPVALGAISATTTIDIVVHARPIGFVGAPQAAA
jgi:hypothetical protein